MTESTRFSSLLKRYRQEAGLSQEDLAARAGLSTRAISDLERGIYKAPRYDTLRLLTEALALSEPQQALLRAAARPEQASALEEASAVAPVSPPPLPPTPLIGRAAERARVLTLLRGPDTRLVTIIGAGGIGKTRLALQLAHDLAGDFPDGVAFVALAPLRSAAFVPDVIAERLRLNEQVDTPRLEQVRAFLQPRRLLLLLDNVEHLLEASPSLADLLATCPHLRVLVTSRAPLRLRAEQVVPLAPLPLEEAVMLFRDRARAIRPDGAFEEATITAICERLDRLPLAIELAASHVRALTLADLLERLAIRLPLLRGGPRDLPLRQQTMRDALAWSYELLTPAQQRCFRALGVFVGGWTEEAARAICWAESESPTEDPFLILAALVEASLVQVEWPAEGTARFSLLELLREYALERLRAAGEEEACRERHATYYAQLAERMTPFGPGSRAGAAHLAQDFPNARAALQWAEERQEVTLGLRLGSTFGHVWFSQGHLREAEEWLERLLVLDRQASAQEPPPELRAEVLTQLGEILLSLGKLERAEALAMDALACAHERADQCTLSMALGLLGKLARRQGRLAEAAAFFTESVTAAQQTAHLSIWGEALQNRMELAEIQGDLALATTLAEEARRLAQAAGIPFVVAGLTTRLGHLARLQGDDALAKAHYREALALFRAFGTPTLTAWCLEGLAATLCAEGHYAQATRLCAAAGALREQAQTPLPPAEQEALEQVVTSTQAAVGKKTCAAEWTLGAALTQDEAIAYALSDDCA